ncbi:iron-sulfur cluster assembly scaffold protein [Thalassobaculum salexigens]|uniref:iron-sulfur cluster assembly scaffold protein n=1 Tax=Thalassobaculum salexigens TaxID=455360 RepID=UPI0003FEE92E|nr:iron-sulfur cluster assembly scaffold protein [Thalassobaculum salexigens]
MNDTLYQDEIVALARAGRALPRLEAPTVSARVDNPVCGDRITVDLTVQNGAVTAVGAKVQGCALCQASIAVIADNVLGQPADTLPTVAKAVEDYLAGKGDTLPWTALSAFSPVRAAKSRWECVMLPFRAANKALAEQG